MRRKTLALVNEEDLLIDLTLHKVPARLVAEFNEKIVRPYYNGNLKAAAQDLISKALIDKEFNLSYITQIQSRNNR
jgi:hypothetical protein